MVVSSEAADAGAVLTKIVPEKAKTTAGITERNKRI